MGQFNSKITAEYNPPRKWILQKALSYSCTDLTPEDKANLNYVGVELTGDNGDTITVKKDFVTDLASVPRMAWAFIAPWDVARAAIIHDLLYKRIRQYRHKFGSDQSSQLVSDSKKVADKVFLKGMEDADPKVPTWKIKAAYWAVRLFGRWSIIPNKDNI